MLAAEAFAARTQRRRTRSAQIILALSLGCAAAVAMSLLAGSRRSSSVVDRFFDAVPRYDVVLSSPALRASDVRGLPGVERADPVAYIALTARDVDGKVLGINGASQDFSLEDPTTRVIAGRRPTPGVEDEVLVNESFVRALDSGVGDVVTVRMFAPDQYEEVNRGVYEPRGPEYQLRVVGVSRSAEDVGTTEVRSPRAGSQSTDVSMLVPAEFRAAHRSEFLDFGEAVAVRLDTGPAGIAPFLEVFGEATGLRSDVLVEPVVDRRRQAFRTPVDLETTVLLVVGIGAAIGAASVGILLVRAQQRACETECQMLRSLGLQSRQLAAVGAVRVIPSAVAAGVIAVVGAAAASGRYPIGIGHQLELRPGLDVDVVVSSVGGVLTAVIPVAVAAAMAARHPRGARHAGQAPARVTVGRALPLHLSLGASLAFGRRRAWTWFGLGGAAIAVATFVAVGVWVDGIDRLYHEPARRGWVWDVVIGNLNFVLEPQRVEELQHSDLLSATTAASYGAVLLNGESIELLAFDHHGTAPPMVVRGRLPASSTEVALGAGALRRLGASIGDRVTMSLDNSEFASEDTPTTEITMMIVGEAASPVFGTSDVADVGVVPLDAIAAAGGRADPKYVLADVPGRDRAASIARISETFSEELQTDVIPARVVYLERVRTVAVVGAALALFVAVVAVLSTIAAAATLNRGTLAVLCALGLDRGGRRRILAWQAAILAAVVLALGVVLGLLAGAGLWRRATDDLGIVPGMSLDPLVLPVATLVIVLVALVSAGLTSPRRREGAVAAALRSE